MNSLVVNIFIVVLHMSTLVNLTPVKNLGAMSCRYLGEFDPNNDVCHVDPVKIKKLPEECTAFVFDGISFNGGGITYVDIETIKSLIKVNNNVHLLYGYNGLGPWSNATQSNDAIVDLKLVKSVLGNVTIAGLIFKGINYGHDFPDGLYLLDDFNEKLNKFIMCAKDIMPNIKIGLYINAKSVIYYSENSATPKPWYDIAMLDKVVDYYVIGFEKFNECTLELLNGGVTPMNSSNPNINTLCKLSTSLAITNITKEKMYLEYLINPTVMPDYEKSTMKCEISYNEYCENYSYKYKWCADNADTFYKKGEFARQYSSGFIGREIDLVDRDLQCNCYGDKYVTFHIVANGFTKHGLKNCTFEKPEK